jgi:hypothetical protein
MTKAKVTQAEADAYMDGWMAYHNGHTIWDVKTCANKELWPCFSQGYQDCASGRLNFDKIMGPNDFEPEELR